jgi:anti-anti-sigma factor
MSFESSFDMTSNGVAKITLSGKLDAGTAPQFEQLIEQAVADKAKRIALLLRDLTFMASAGLRVLVLAKQKVGSAVDIYVIEAQEQVVDTIKMTGLDYSVTILETYDAAVVENI